MLPWVLHGLIGDSTNNFAPCLIIWVTNHLLQHTLIHRKMLILSKQKIGYVMIHVLPFVFPHSHSCIINLLLSQFMTYLLKSQLDQNIIMIHSKSIKILKTTLRSDSESVCSITQIGLERGSHNKVPNCITAIFID
jgi:hypothetical protein